MLAKPRQGQDLEKAIAAANTSLPALSSFLAAGLEFSGEMPHKLLHFVVDEAFQSTDIVFASPYVAEKVTRRIAEGRGVEVRLLISSTASLAEFAALRGILFEQVAHDKLRRGGKFSLVALNNSSAGALEVKEQTLKSEIFTSLTEFTAIAAPGVYAQPAAKNFAAVDAVLVPPAPVDAPVYFLQMTVSRDHPIKAAAFNKLRNALPDGLHNRKLCFVFVVPEDVVAGYAAQPFHTVGHKVMQNPPSVEQYVLSVPLATQPQPI